MCVCIESYHKSKSNRLEILKTATIVTAAYYTHTHIYIYIYILYILYYIYIYVCVCVLVFHEFFTLMYAIAVKKNLCG